MSTNSDDEPVPLSGWMSQAEAARLCGVSRQAISKLVGVGRLKSKRIGGRLLVSRAEVEGLQPLAAGRPPAGESRDFDRLWRLVETATPEVQLQVYRQLRKGQPSHPLETRIGLDAEVILTAIERSGELTLRMIRGVIAEAAFDVYVARSLEGWDSEPTPTTSAYDFLLRDRIGAVRVQVKLQRSEAGVPKFRRGKFVVETQRTRSGIDQGTGESTRPYRFGEFDILAVAMQPSAQDWARFFYTVADWLAPRAGRPDLMDVHQPVATEPNDDWTDDFGTCVNWLRSGVKKSVGRFS